MCRLLSMHFKEPVNVRELLHQFAIKCQQSTEFQGHGWGIVFFDGISWQEIKDINPIWEYNFDDFVDIQQCVVHARSAFKDEGIMIENNMPFSSGDYVFIFNGELRDVKLKVDGRIGAEKIFNLILRFDSTSLLDSIKKANRVISKRTGYIRANNFIVINKKTSEQFINSQYSEDAEYFQMYITERQEGTIISSEKIDEYSWNDIPKNYTERYVL